MREIDIRHLIPNQIFFMIARWDELNVDRRCVEMEEAARLGVTDVDNFGGGLCFNRREDAERVAEAMTHRLGYRHAVISSEEMLKTGPDLIDNAVTRMRDEAKWLESLAQENADRERLRMTSGEEEEE